MISSVTNPLPELSEALQPSLRHSGDGRVRCYSSQFADVMEMRAPAATVAAYLDRHEGWFRRCASPMQVQPLDGNGYVLTLGTFGNFGCWAIFGKKLTDTFLSKPNIEADHAR